MKQVKILLTSLFICLLFINSKTQTPLGKITYVHLTHFTNDSNSKNGKAILLFNNTESTYFHPNAPKKSKLREINGVTTPVGGDGEGFPVYKNLKTKVLLYKEFLGLTPKKCIVNDTLPTIDWKITGETKKISSFNCQKAVGTFAGRIYDAWFTLEIPISSGPYKLHGLPGLILEAKSQDGKVEFLFSSAEVSKNIDGEITSPKQGEKFDSYEMYQEASNKQVENTLKRAKAKGMDIKIETNVPDSKIEIRNE